MKIILKLRWLLVVVSLIVLSSFEPARAAADFEYITIYKARPGKSAMYTVFTRLKNNELLCAFRSSILDEKGNPWTIPGSKIVCIRSADNGRTWSDTPTVIYKEDKDNWPYTSESGFGYQAEDGTILVSFHVFNPLSNLDRYDDPLYRAWNFIARSKDNGYTWECERLSSAPFFSTLSYGIFRLKNGSLWIAQPCLGYKIKWSSFQGKDRVTVGNTPRGCLRLLESRDGGKSWSHYSYIGYDPTRPKETESMPKFKHQEEPTIVELGSGKILMMTRPYMLQGISLDRGRTWEIGPSTLTKKGGETSGLCPSMWYTKAGPPSGTVVLAWHDRWGEHKGKGGVYITFSHDEGQTWGYAVRIDGGAYPALYELEKDSGKFLCGYYLHKSLLKGAFFSVPFPTGIHSTASMKDSGLPCITVEWDAYKGEDCKDYEYRVYRSTKDGASLEQSKLVFSGKDVCSYADKAVEKDRAYYYRVAAFRNGKVTNQSWQSSAMVTVNAGF